MGRNMFIDAADAINRLVISGLLLSFMLLDVGKTENVKVRLFNADDIALAVPHKPHFIGQFKAASIVLFVLSGVAARAAIVAISAACKETLRHYYVFVICSEVVRIVCCAWIPWLAHAARVVGPKEVSISTTMGAMPYVAFAGYTIAGGLLYLKNREKSKKNI